MGDADDVFVIRKRGYAGPSLEEVSPFTFAVSRTDEEKNEWFGVGEVILVRKKDASIEGRCNVMPPTCASYYFQRDSEIAFFLGIRSDDEGSPRIAIGTSPAWPDEDENRTVRMQINMCMPGVYMSRDRPILGDITLQRKEGRNDYYVSGVRLKINENALMEQLEVVTRPPPQRRKATKHEEEDDS
jgi:hypothetical protein